MSTKGDDISYSQDDLFHYSPWLISLSCTVSGAFIFYLGTLYGKSQAKLSHTQIAKQVENKIAARILNHGWRPGLISIGGVDFYVSYFKPALLGSVAFPTVTNEKNEKKFLLLNIQNRILRSGEAKDVIDFPCGFHQSNQEDLTYKQALLKYVDQKKKTEGREITAEELQNILTQLQRDIKNGATQTPPLPADKNVTDTAIRELLEETGQKGLTLKNSMHFKSRLVQGGSYLYNLVELNYKQTGKLDFTPEVAEGIRSSHLVELQAHNFRFTQTENGKVQGQVLIPDSKRWIEIKPYDDTAAMMAAYLTQYQAMTFDSIDTSLLTQLNEELSDTKYEHQSIPAATAF